MIAFNHNGRCNGHKHIWLDLPTCASCYFSLPSLLWNMAGASRLKKAWTKFQLPYNIYGGARVSWYLFALHKPRLSTWIKPWLRTPASEFAKIGRFACLGDQEFVFLIPTGFLLCSIGNRKGEDQGKRVATINSVPACFCKFQFNYSLSWYLNAACV